MKGFINLPISFFFAVQISCPGPDWTLLERSCYYFKSEYIDWIGGNTSCGQLVENSHLVTITSEEERLLVIDLVKRSLAPDALAMSFIWIGGTDYFGEEGAFQWVTGESWNPSTDMWAPNQPTDHLDENDDKDCIALTPLIEGDTNGGKFCDFWCYSYLVSVCEIEVRLL